MSAADLKQLESSLEALLESLRTASVLVEDYRAENSGRLLSTVNGVVQQFGVIATQARTVGQNVALPRELFDFIDTGRNPDLYTHEVLAGLVRESEQVRGKLHALADYEALLRAEMVAAFPQLDAHLTK